ncbi:MAG: transketolase [Rhodospirillaceae bacterium]|jgi:transketolase|nr:transketolase [Rhodospirillaceae bacterium]MBT5081481.1 transketolase [Rhodospirillaceae bacterium]MBT5526923.1 transketolase [Rhodospirillaceae bacterium]MBT5881819.1 transketolase [Rhodospirillaceae bacterium]MBT6587524.1 transketolase [Rhodospirillaceae bacterium]
MRNALIDLLCELADNDPDIWLLTADLGYSVLERFAERFPERYINVGVAEQNMVGIAAGLALSGKRVVIYSIVNFVTMRCLEQIRNDICAHGANVVIVGVGAGYSYGAQGYTHHGLEDISVMRALPGLDVTAPGNCLEAEAVLRVAMQHDGPTYIRLEKDAGASASLPLKDIERGRMACYREGGHAAIVATGGMLGEALGAAELLERDGLSVAVWSCPWITPLDTATLDLLTQRHDVILTAEEGVINGGLGSATALALANVAAKSRLLVAGVGEVLSVPTLSQTSARNYHALDAAGLAARLLSVCSGHEVSDLLG